MEDPDRTLDDPPQDPDRTLDAVVDPTPALVPTGRPRLPDRIDRYHILKEIGEGGMGAVYLAEQRHPIKRRVALKVIRLGYESTTILARFDSERQALARMDHPNVAKVLDAGTTDAGLPFFAMEYVPGLPIAEFCDKNRLSIEQRLRLFIKVCDAIGHAHGKGLLHRDIKSHNVLAFMDDGEPVVKVIDFGIAKAIGDEAIGVAQTGLGAMIGTPYAMSPEQAEGSPDIDTRTDVYALGVLLYELLGGRLPFEIAELRRHTLPKMVEVIAKQEPPKLSTFLRGAPDRAEVITAARSTKPAALARKLAKELEWIPLKAIRKDRKRRYQTTFEMSGDVLNYFDGKPLTAGPESTWYRLRKFAVRNGVVLATTAAVFLAFTVGGVVYTLNIRAEKNRAEEALKAATDMVDFATSVFRQASPGEGRADITVIEALNHAVAELDRQPGSTLHTMELALLRTHIGAILCEAGDYKAAEQQLSIALADRARFAGNAAKIDTLIEEIYRDLASAQTGLGEFDQAAESYRQAILVCDRMRTQDPVVRATVLNDFGTFLRARGEPAKAADHFNQALSAVDSSAVPQPLIRAKILNNLGIVAEDTGDFTTALARYGQSLGIRRQSLQPDDVDIAESQMNIGQAFAKSKRDDRAVEPMEKALAIYHLHGDGWFKTLRCRLNYARALRMVGRLAEAEQQYRLCVAGFASQTPPMEDDLAAARSGYGQTLLLTPEHIPDAGQPLLESFEYRFKNKDAKLRSTADALVRYYTLTKQLQKADEITDRMSSIR